MVIIMSYCELWAVLLSWKKQFSVKEFSSTFSSPDPNKVLHDMAKKGLLEREGWGKYKVNSPKEYLSKKNNITASYNLLKQASMRYALTGPDGVFFWTKGAVSSWQVFWFLPDSLEG